MVTNSRYCCSGYQKEKENEGKLVGVLEGGRESIELKVFFLV